MSTFTAIDLSGIPAPNVVEPLSYETIFDEMLLDLQGRDDTFTALVDSDPAFKILQVAAYRELLLRQRVNDASRANMLPYAVDADLDNLAAYFGVTRLTLDPGDPDGLPPIPPTMESNDDLRSRTQLALEAFTTAGSEGSYIFHGRSAHAQVKDIGVASPTPGDVVITVLSRLGNGTPTSDIITAVTNGLNEKDKRPLTDNVTVQAATILSYTVTAVLYIPSGPDPQVVLQAALVRLTKYVEDQHRVGRRVAKSGITAALHVAGVERVVLSSPSTDKEPTSAQAAYCTGINVTIEGA